MCLYFIIEGNTDQSIAKFMTCSISCSTMCIYYEIKQMIANKLVAHYDYYY